MDYAVLRDSDFAQVSQGMVLVRSEIQANWKQLVKPYFEKTGKDYRRYDLNVDVSLFLL